VFRALQAQELRTSPDFLPVGETDAELARKRVARWEQAPDWSRDRAEARHTVLLAAEQYIAGQSGGKTKAEVTFCRRYNTDPSQFGIDPATSEHVKRLSPASLRRFRALYASEGLSGLLSNHGANKGKRLSVIPSLRVFILAQLQERPHIKASALRTQAEGAFGTDLPSEATFKRVLQDIKDSNPQLFATLENPKRWKNSFMAAFGDAMDAEYFGHVWEMDSTPADVMTADGKRVCIVGCIDVYSRRLVLLCATSSKAVSVAATIRKAMLAWGKPARIRMDNGKDYRSRHVTAILSAFDIERDSTRPYHGEDKPFIERALGTYTHGLHELLPHYTGHDVKERAALRERSVWAKRVMEGTDKVVDIPLTMDQLQEATDQWLTLYETTPRQELGNMHPLARAHSSPRQPAKIKDERILDILLAPIKTDAAVGKKGIAYDGRKFSADELIPYVGSKVDVRIDLENAGKLYVFHREGNRVKFVCTATDAAWDGTRVASYTAAKKAHAQKLREEKRALQVLSETIDDPNTLIMQAGAARIEKYRAERGNVTPFQAKADTSAMREAARVFETPKQDAGLAQQYGMEPQPEPTLPDGVVRLPVREVRPKEALPSFEYPIEAYDWLCAREERDGALPPDLYEWKVALEKSDSVQDILRLRAETAALANVERRF
jgi:hypothetical protein